MFRFTTGESAEFHTAVLTVFADATERMETALGLDDVLGGLRSVGWLGEPTEDALAAALDQLRAWQLVDVVQNHTENYRTAREYERRNLQYSLTKRGEAAFAGAVRAMEVLTATGALQTAVLDAIADRLGELHRLLTGSPGTDRKVFTALTELEGHLDALRSNTTRFTAELHRLLRAEGAELATFREVKAATVAYLEEFLINLDQRAHAIRSGIDLVEDLGLGLLHHRALHGAELPPVSDGDPGPPWLAHRRARWDGLRNWFHGPDPRVNRLHRQARRAIVTLLQVLDRITESRRRASSAAADFRELARWFAHAPTEDDLHRLWSTAFGLSSARHAHLLHPDPDLHASTAAWRGSDPVPVSALLRSSGRAERFTRTGRVRDVAEIRAERAREALRQELEVQAAWDMLDTGGPVWLSRIGELPYDVFTRFLDLLGRALSTAPDSSGARRAVTADGRVEIVLRPPATDATARLRTPHGVFSGPDYNVEITAVEAGGGRRQRRRAR
ncbi:TIGR02677 family protein [Actinokineospora auranticolor]|nr:TIGR02677 family protein [Actinokineospora auranticolor]